MTDKTAMKNLCEFAFNPGRAKVDSLILVYTDIADVRGPFVTYMSAMSAYDKAVSTGRPFVFRSWATTVYG